MPRKEQLAEVVSVKVWAELAAVFFICLAGVFFGARFVGQKWAEFPYIYQEMTVLNQAEPGGFLDLQISVNRTKLCPHKFYREIYDGEGARVDQYTWTQGAKPAGPDEYSIRIPIPKSARKGPLARYCVSQAPQCNVLQVAVPYWTPLKCVAFEIK